MSFTCGACGCRYFHGSRIQGGEHLDLTLWSVVVCLSCNVRYLWHDEQGFKPFLVELVK